MSTTILKPFPMARRSWVMVTFAVIVSVAYFLAAPSQNAEGIRIAVPFFSAVVVMVGVSLHRPDRRVGWYLLAGSLLSQGVAASLWMSRFFADERTFPTVVEPIRLLSMVLLLVGVAALAHEDRRSEDMFGPIEISIVAIASSVVVWLLVIEPIVASSSLPLDQKVWSAAIPMIGSLALALSVRLASQSRFRQPAPLAILCGTMVMLGAELGRSIGELREWYGPGGYIAALAVSGPLLLAAAALDPSMVVRNRHIPESPGDSRVVGLSIAALTPLTVLSALIVADVGSVTTRVIAAAAALAVVLLALARMWGLVDTVRVLTERRGQDRLAAMVEHSTDVVVLVDEAGRIRYASPGLRSTLGHRSEDWLGRPLIDLVVSDDRTAADAELTEVVSLGRGGTVKFEASLVRVDGERRRMEATIANLIGGDAVDGIVATFRDVTAQRDLERRLSRRAFHDDLTGLVNRSLFIELMDQALSMANAADEPVVVLFVDLDDFKAVNDALGHSVGDELLCHIAECIRRTTQLGDTTARLGGDEFAILLGDDGGVSRAINVGEALLDALRDPVTLAGYELSVLASVGVAVSSRGTTTTSMLRDADIAMYEAKRSGKGQIKIFDPAMRLGAAQHLEFRTDLARAIERNELRVVFQPQIDMATGQFSGAEALVRWHHPERGDVPPSDFIPVAERAGLILSIGSWVLDESICQATRWQETGPHEVSVNVSALQLRVPSFVDDVRAALLKHGLAPERLTLEITETALVDEIEEASHVLAELRGSGIRVAIDDFGTGYCSLSYLQRFPVDIVKIDRQFIEELSDDKRTTSLATMILQMTASLGVLSVAEGIERPEQMAALKKMGCDIGQGYLLSSPLDSEAICLCLDNAVHLANRPISAGTDVGAAPSTTVRSLSVDRTSP